MSRAADGVLRGARSFSQATPEESLDAEVRSHLLTASPKPTCAAG